MLGWLKRLWQGRQEGALARGVLSDLATPTQLADGFIPASQFSASSDMRILYEATAHSYACIVANAIEASSLGAQVQRREDGRWIRTEHEHLTPFLDAPSGRMRQGHPTSPPQWSWSQLVFLQVAHLYLNGNAYLVPTIVRNGARLWSVAPLLPAGVTITQDKSTGYPSSYKAGGETYKPHELVHMMFTNPLEFHRGHAPICAALRAIDINYAASERIKWNLDNKVSPGIVLSVEGFMGLQDTQRTAILNHLTENYVGAAADGRPMVFGEGTKVLGAPAEQSKMPLIALIEHAQQQVRAVFRTPPPVLGIYDNATLNNFSEAFKLWWLLGLFPILEMVYASINTQLIQPIYGPEWRLWWDDTNSPIAQVLRREKIQDGKELVQGYGYPPNLAAKFVGLGLEHVPELDVPLQNLTLAGRGPSSGDAA